MADDSTETDVDEGVERILVVTAHPDDVDFGSAGSVATWTDAGIEVVYCIVTDGDAGGFDRDVPRHVMAETRRAEQTAAAKVVGVTELHFLGHPDGRLEPTLDLRRDISRVIRQVRPQRVVAQSPERSYERIYASHPDHLAAGEATLCAVYPDARNPFAHPGAARRRGARAVDGRRGVDRWRAGEPPDRFVDITDVFDRKLEALLLPREPAPRARRARGPAARVEHDARRGRGLPDGPPGRGLLPASPRPRDRVAARSPRSRRVARLSSRSRCGSLRRACIARSPSLTSSRVIVRLTMSPRSSLPVSTRPMSFGKSRRTWAEPYTVPSSRFSWRMSGKLGIVIIASLRGTPTAIVVPPARVQLNACAMRSAFPMTSNA